MATPKRYESEVSGIGPFPVDMLRYDAAYPAREEDSVRIMSSIDRRLAAPGSDERNARHHVRVISERHLTSARWQSFGWLVDTTRQVR